MTLVVLICSGWIGLRYIESHSVACDCEDPVDAERVALWNPFRDRSSEKIAIEVVGAEQSGKCIVLSTGAEYCPEVSEATVTSWKLTGRSVTGNTALVRFWVLRPKTRLGDPLWVRMQRQGGAWKVDRVDTYY